jgi:hypothetical protein
MKMGQIIQNDKYAGYMACCPICGNEIIDTLSDDIECNVCGATAS